MRDLKLENVDIMIIKILSSVQNLYYHEKVAVALIPAYRNWLASKLCHFLLVSWHWEKVVILTFEQLFV